MPLYALLLAISLAMALPLLWMLSTSLKETQAVFSARPAWVPHPLRWQNYLQIWTIRGIPFACFFLNSVVVAACVTAGHLGASACAAYAFARLRFPGRDRLFFAYIATMMIPGSVTIIPVFIIMKALGWVDTYRALIIPGMFTAFGTFLLRQFFLSIPQDIEDAAKIDGASPFLIFWRIVLPMSKPALAALAISTFMGNWQSFMWPLLVVDSVEKKTLPIGLAYFQDQYATNWPLLMAGSVVAMLPIIMMFVSNQRFFLGGIKLTGVQR